MNIRKVFCFFEQSGTFKNEFIKLGIPAEDYDIQNEYSQTDHIMDLFKEIESAYDGKPSLFDKVEKDDLIMAFFPCIYFDTLQAVYYNLSCINYRGKSKEQVYSILFERIRNREKFYTLLYKLYAVCDLRELRLIIENPATQPNYLMSMNFPKPAVIDMDRTRRGDKFKKPTAYWFLNIAPPPHSQLSITKPKEVSRIKESRRGKQAGVCSKDRSEITSDYARNFICDFILGKKQENTILTLF